MSVEEFSRYNQSYARPLIISAAGGDMVNMNGHRYLPHSYPFHRCHTRHLCATLSALGEENSASTHFGCVIQNEVEQLKGPQHEGSLYRRPVKLGQVWIEQSRSSLHLQFCIYHPAFLSGQHRRGSDGVCIIMFRWLL